MNDPVIFLDIDGVLNNAKGIDPICVVALNQIIDATGAKIVVSSAWRYQIIDEEKTLLEFEMMLRDYGVNASLIGYTKPESKKMNDPMNDRENQILDFVKSYKIDRRKTAWIAIDDNKLELEEINAIRTNGRIGLIEKDAQLAIEKIKEQQERNQKRVDREFDMATVIDDILWYDGPLVYTVFDDQNRLHLAYEIKGTNEFLRYIVVPITDEEVRELKEEYKEFRSYFCNKECFIVDEYKDGVRVDTKRVDFKDIEPHLTPIGHSLFRPKE